MGAASMTGPRRLYRNARLLDPESGLDQRGDLLVEGDRIAAFGPDIGAASAAMPRSSISPGCASRPASSICACSCASPAPSTWN